MNPTDILIAKGDLGELTEAQRVEHYHAVCLSAGLDPVTQPLAYLKLQGKTVLYALRAATEQLRAKHHVSVTITARDLHADLGVYVVTARASMPNGRQDENIGAVPIKGLSGEALSNALMKAETKAKRRVTLAICGLGMLDESETDSIPGAIAVTPPAPHARIERKGTPVPPPPDPAAAALAACRAAWKSIGDELVYPDDLERTTSILAPHARVLTGEGEHRAKTDGALAEVAKKLGVKPAALVIAVLAAVKEGAK